MNGGFDREKSARWDFNSGCLKHNEATCRRSLYQIWHNFASKSGLFIYFFCFMDMMFELKLVEMSSLRGIITQEKHFNHVDM